MRNNASDQTKERGDEVKVDHPQRRSEDASEDNIRPPLPNHGDRHVHTRSSERGEPPNHRARVDVSDIKMMALMRQDQEDRLHEAEMANQQERQNEIQSSTTRSRQDEMSYNTEEFSSYSTGVESSSQNQYERSPVAYSNRDGRIDGSGAPAPSEQAPGSINLSDFIVQEEEEQTVVAVPIIPAKFNGTPQAKTEEERTKPKTYRWFALAIVVVALVVGIVVVATIGMKGNSNKSSSSVDTHASSDETIPEPSTLPPTTHKPSTLPPTTPEPTTQVPTSPATWGKYGSTIDGENAGDQFGYFIALSGDGSTIAGVTKSDGDGGDVRVFRIKRNSWTQIGYNINGVETENEFAMTVATSYDGSTVAIGGPGYGPTLKGRVRVFEYNSVTDWWSPLGDSIHGLKNFDVFGSSVSLSGNGRILAVGACLADENGEDSGHVRVFGYGGGTEGWDQVGQTIGGENSLDKAGDQESVKLSHDGEVVSIGASFNDGRGSNTGHVRVFWCDRAANEWTQMGQDIEVKNTEDSKFGLSVDLSGDGTMIAIGAPGYENDGQEDCGLVQVYAYNHGNDNWYKVFGLIGLVGDECGISVSLSGDGTKVAFGCYQYFAGEGKLFIYQDNKELGKWVNTLYVAGEKYNDHFGASVSLSDDGNVVAAGGNGNDGNGNLSGHIRVYKLE